MPSKLTPHCLEVPRTLHHLAARRCSTTIDELAAELNVSDQGLATLNIGIPVYGEVAAGQPGFADQTAGPVGISP